MDTSHITTLLKGHTLIIRLAYDKYSLLYFNIVLHLILTGVIIYFIPWSKMTPWKIFGIVGIMIFLLYFGCQSHVYRYFNKEVSVGLNNGKVIVNGYFFCNTENLKCVYVENIRGRYSHGRNVSLLTYKKQEVVLRKHLNSAEAEMIAGNIAGFLGTETKVK